jgi:hypothetical protein
MDEKTYITVLYTLPLLWAWRGGVMLDQINDIFMYKSQQEVEGERTDMHQSSHQRL